MGLQGVFEGLQAGMQQKQQREQQAAQQAIQQAQMQHQQQQDANQNVQNLMAFIPHYAQQGYTGQQISDTLTPYAQKLGIDPALITQSLANLPASPEFVQRGQMAKERLDAQKAVNDSKIAAAMARVHARLGAAAALTFQKTVTQLIEKDSYTPEQATQIAEYQLDAAHNAMGIPNQPPAHEGAAPTNGAPGEQSAPSPGQAIAYLLGGPKMQQQFGVVAPPPKTIEDFLGAETQPPTTPNAPPGKNPLFTSASPGATTRDEMRKSMIGRRDQMNANDQALTPLRAQRLRDLSAREPRLKKMDEAKMKTWEDQQDHLEAMTQKLEIEREFLRELYSAQITHYQTQDKVDLDGLKLRKDMFAWQKEKATNPGLTHDIRMQANRESDSLQNKVNDLDKEEKELRIQEALALKILKKAPQQGNAVGIENYQKAQAALGTSDIPDDPRGVYHGPLSARLEQIQQMRQQIKQQQLDIYPYTTTGSQAKRTSDGGNPNTGKALPKGTLPGMGPGPRGNYSGFGNSGGIPTAPPPAGVKKPTAPQTRSGVYKGKPYTVTR